MPERKGPKYNSALCSAEVYLGVFSALLLDLQSIFQTLILKFIRTTFLSFLERNDGVKTNNVVDPLLNITPKSLYGTKSAEIKKTL